MELTKLVIPPAHTVLNSVTELKGSNGTYQITRILGEGAYGKVYLGKHVIRRGIVEHVAIKLALGEFKKTEDEERLLDRQEYQQFDVENKRIYNNWTKDQQARHWTRRRRERSDWVYASTVRESIIMRHLNVQKVHGVPHLVDVIKGVTADDRHMIYVVMSYTPGQTLYDYIYTIKSSTSRLETSSKLVDMMKQLVKIVRDINGACILHNDLKPANILVTTHHQLVVIDFGLSCVLTPCATSDTIESEVDMTCNATQITTEGYTPPEIQHKARLPDDYQKESLDWYSVGQICRNMLRASNNNDDLQDLYAGNFDSIDTATENIWLRKAIKGLLDWDYKTRLNFDEALDHLEKVELIQPFQLKRKLH